MKSPPKIYAFIDSQNLNLGIQSCGWKLDFNRFFIYLKDKYRVDKAFLFIGYLAGNESLYTSLQRSGYIIIFKPTLEYKKQGKFFTKGNIDAELVLHAMIEYPYYDKAIIISGDGDFYCLIEYLEKMNSDFPWKLVFPVQFNRFFSAPLISSFLKRTLIKRKE